MEISFFVNNRKYTLKVDPKDSLLSILRDQLNLTATKNGCSQGHCGACTVVMNGEAIKSCLIRPRKLDGANIITIEGISPRYPNDELHPIQKAFIETTAVQCGFCTSGYIMELYALYERSTNVSEQEIKSTLDGHLCRCTGYKPVLDAALLAQELLNRNKS
ncbi:MAG: (2Fe-2S)-binding protein [Candidatus Heimdallarchaeota archaeon]|nr:MAG: (2Fe-2S)-binding protein [Candidatus Heimdallarchaeota archaeon]